jgi:hypothetical protein
MIRNTPENHSEYQSLAIALDKTEQVVDFVNKRKRVTENYIKLYQTQNHIEGLGVREVDNDLTLTGF